MRSFHPCGRIVPNESPSGNHASRRFNARRATTLLCARWIVILLGLAAGAPSLRAAHPDWKHLQELDVPAAGIVKVRLPADTLNAARPQLEDLRIVGPDGGELAFLIDRPRASSQLLRRPGEFRVTVEESRTRIDLDRTEPARVTGLLLETPAPTFVKAVTIEATDATGGFRQIVASAPVFRQEGGASQLAVRFPEVRTRRLRVTLDDRRAPPIPVSGAQLFELETDPPPNEEVPATITERTETTGETVFSLDLGAAHLTLASIRFETPEPLFTRRVTVIARHFQEGELRERTLASATVHRVAVDDNHVASQLEVPIDLAVSSRELLVRVDNADSPPLQITRLRVERRPVFAVFLAREAGAHRLYSGNFKATPPRYDLAALSASLRSLPPGLLNLPPLAPNPDYRPSETLPTIPMLGAPLDPKEWSFRKRVDMEKPGVQQLEFDLQILSRAQPGFGDLRLVSEGRQVPFILERTSITRTIDPEVKLAPDPKRPRVSRWSLTLPEKGLPVVRLACDARTPLFQRSMRLYEEARDERGEIYRRDLGSATWQQTPDRRTTRWTIEASSRPQSAGLFLETDNGDNPALELERFQVTHPVTRLLFKATNTAGIHLYYGNRDAIAPGYDLGLVADQVLAAPKVVARTAPEEALRKTSWLAAGEEGGRGTIVFWGVLAIVVVGLLVVLTRLLPRAGDGGNPPG